MASLNPLTESDFEKKSLMHKNHILRSKFSKFILRLAHNSYSLRALLSVAGILLGIFLGYSLKLSPQLGSEYWRSPRRMEYVKFPGLVFTDIMTCVSLPVLICAIVAAIGSMRIRTCGHVAIRIVLYIFISNFCASFVGVLVAFSLQPGSPHDHPIHAVCFQQGQGRKDVAVCTKDGHPCLSSDYSQNIWAIQAELKNKTKPKGPFCGKRIQSFNCAVIYDTFIDLFRSFFLDNILNAFLEGSKTEVNFDSKNNPSKNRYQNCKDYQLADHPKPPLTEYDVKITPTETANIQGIIIFFIVFGIAGLSTHESGLPVLNVFTSLSTCTLKMGNWATWLSLVGMWSLMAAYILDNPTTSHFPATIWSYVVTCSVANIVYAYAILPSVYFFFLKQSPLKFYKNIFPSMCIAFGTSSTSRAIPMTIEILEEVCGLDPRIVRLMIPIASQINKDGHAISTAVASVYIAQLHAVEYTVSSFCMVTIMTVVAVFLAPSDLYSNDISFVFRMRVALNSMGLPGVYFTYVAPIQWILHGSVQVTNLVTDCVGAAIVDHLCRDYMKKADAVDEMAVKEETRSKHRHGQGSKANTNKEFATELVHLHLPPIHDVTQTQKREDDFTDDQDEDEQKLNQNRNHNQDLNNRRSINNLRANRRKKLSTKINSGIIKQKVSTSSEHSLVGRKRSWRRSLSQAPMKARSRKSSKTSPKLTKKSMHSTNSRSSRKPRSKKNTRDSNPQILT